ncbi:MAG: formate dehydrogenase accessory sulfurtransferase FdhD [Gammaproteobacteria bacterium]|jgi:FdhD protein|uniref:formate dehydrogenase accessory sulfurtransferase FdhD n=1 Tax=Marinomonas sp. BSi20584 TaxID=1594462 RepID=UPI000C1E8563|nr:formate dehydrogenase accessory sulfurtransferase FdhD [Marinomonas sp. BSi20584]MBU1293778.1 formate dehydrogenase accessory sulfurtransferase FdhD [Gammaproteobacteria bacterium]MBU1466864.1 formate dehydrogenase accessory sulfurtransferase FdhD [Gammaproteobacteria bacterium]MBU2021232.1 formate dehydrogenase accessory sulfurtransferase FdhD [Gammaproteobacteria bacterium]MBU2238724.1 formate dehydrogenase accessory sulfurtransferase FdhD [Gammaproteobacteria bacterium]MBU2320084.1 forma
MQHSPISFISHRCQKFGRCDALQDKTAQQGIQLEQEPLEATELVEEMPLAISINDISYAVMMVTPVNLEAFVIGFARSEGIIEHINDIRDIAVQLTQTPPDIDCIAINLELSPRRFAQFKKRRQTHLGATGCGLCGIESLTQAIPILPKLQPSQAIKEANLIALRPRLGEYQILGNKTGAVHAALLISPEGEPILCMEDIGRHNALDKVIGYALQQNINLHNYSVLMSSRCSTELIQKAVRVGLSRLIHLASPSTLAVKLAQHYGLTLIHLPKQDAPRLFASSAKPEGTDDEQKK